MPKHVRRYTFTRSINYTVTIDTPGRPEDTSANVLIANGGANGATGVMSIAHLLAGSIANAGITAWGGDWVVSGSGSNEEPYTVRPKNAALPLGARIVSVNPPSGYEAALGKLFVVSTAGTTANTDTEPNWPLTDGTQSPIDGSVYYRAIPKFYTPTTAVTATTYAVGTILRPSANSLKEFLVTAQSGNFTTPTWTSNDTLGTSFSAGAATLLCIAGCRTYAFLTQYALGDVVKPSAGSSDEYIVTTAGKSDSSALSTTVGSSVTRGTATFKRIV